MTAQEKALSFLQLKAANDLLNRLQHSLSSNENAVAAIALVKVALEDVASHLRPADLTEALALQYVTDEANKRAQQESN